MKQKNKLLHIIILKKIYLDILNYFLYINSNFKQLK